MRRARVLLAGIALVVVVGGLSGCLLLNQAPQADFEAHPAVGMAPLTVQLDAGSSFDNDGAIQAYVWTVRELDGTTRFISSAENTTYTFYLPGSYEVALEVNDNQGQVSAVSQSIIVTEADSSASDRLVIVSWDLDFDDEFHGTWVLTGTAKNVCGKRIASAAIHALFHDDDDQVVGTGITFAFDLDADATWTFAIPLNSATAVESVRYAVPSVAAANL